MTDKTNKVISSDGDSVVVPKGGNCNVEPRMSAGGNIESLKSIHPGIEKLMSTHTDIERPEAVRRNVEIPGVGTPGARRCSGDAPGVPPGVPVHEVIAARLVAMGDETKARHQMRFFKTGPGQYGEGDRFLGVTVPAVRAIVREYRRTVTEEDVMALTGAPWHEVRLAGFLSLIEIYGRVCRQGSEAEVRAVVELYLSLIDRGNNWDLVDLVAPKILGHWLVSRPAERGVLDRLAATTGLWHQRVAVVATLPLICAGEYGHTLYLASALLHHPHDLMHKAVGWMLREVGKRGGHDGLLIFLDSNARDMPRTMLRYAIERLEEPVRRHYMSQGRCKCAGA